MRFSEIIKAIFLPVHYILNPQKAGTESFAVSATSAHIQAFFSLLILFSAFIGLKATAGVRPEFEQFIMTGAILFPITLCLIGVLLHFVYPAKDPKYRIARMVCVPWNILACAITIGMTLLVLQFIYFSISDTTPEEIIRITKSMGIVNYFIVAFYSATILINCLSNIRKTSKLRNSGDALIIIGLFSIPFIISM